MAKRQVVSHHVMTKLKDIFNFRKQIRRLIRELLMNRLLGIYPDTQYVFSLASFHIQELFFSGVHPIDEILPLFRHPRLAFVILRLQNCIMQLQISFENKLLNSIVLLCRRGDDCIHMRSSLIRLCECIC